jgi:hypothetical protein
MLTVVWFKYKPHIGYRSTFTAEHVNTSFSGFSRNFKENFQPVCITDDAEGLHRDIRPVKIWDDHAQLPNPHGDGQPRCYRRLKMFDPETAKLIGDRILQQDLDIVYTGDVTPTFSRKEPIVLLPTINPNIPFNGSMTLMDAGARPEVWNTFDPKTSPLRNRKAGCHGSDQGQISFCLRNNNEATWKIGANGEGIYFWGAHLTKVNGMLPMDARLVSFHGRVDPWGPEARKQEWVREHYR